MVTTELRETIDAKPIGIHTFTSREHAAQYVRDNAKCSPTGKHKFQGGTAAHWYDMCARLELPDSDIQWIVSETLGQLDFPPIIRQN